MHTAPRIPSASRWQTAVDSAITGVVESALAHLRRQPTVQAAREVRVILDRAPDRVRARGLAAVAEVLAGRGRLEEALAAAGEGLALAQDLGEHELEKAHRRLRRRLDTADRRAVEGWASLTPAEWRVAEQVATGRQYAEIAARLFVSRRTVEAHVASVFRKVGVASKGELRAAYLARQNTAGTDTSTTAPPLIGASA